MHKIVFTIVFCSLLKFIKCNKLLLKEEKQEFQPGIMNLIDFMFGNESCVQLFTDKTNFSWTILMELYKTNRVPAIINNPVEEETECKNILVVMNELYLTNLSLINAKLFYGNKALLVFERYTNHTAWLLNENAGELLFKDAEGLVVITRPPSMYSRVQPKTDLERVNSLAGAWNRRDYEIKDFLGKTLNVATFNCNIYSHLGPLDSHSSPGRVEGVEASIMMEITTRLNLRWKTLVPEEPNKWGSLQDNRTWDGGVLKLLQGERADVAFCGLWVDVGMLETGLEMSVKIGEACLKFVVPRPRPEVSGWRNIFKPFQLEVWILILLFFVLSTAFLYVFSFISSLWYTQHTEFKKIENSLFEILTIYLTAGTDKKLIGAVRQLVFAFIVLSFLFNSCFSSGLFSQLTIPKYSEKMDTIQQLVDNEYYWTTSSFPDSTMMFDLEDPLERTWSRRAVKVDGWENVSTMYRSDPRMALVGNQLGKGFNFDEENYPEEFLKNFEASSVCHMSKSYAFGYRKGSPYVRPFDRIISRILSAGIANKLLDNIFDTVAPKQPYVYQLLEYEKSHMSQHRSLSLGNVVGVFHMFVTGLVISLIAFICELIINITKTSAN